MRRINDFYQQFVDENRFWLEAAVGLFIVGALAGIATYFVKPELITSIAGVFQDKFGPAPAFDIHLAIQIFIQNLLVSLIGLFGGIVLGLGPLIVLGVNGFLLGFVFASILFSDASAWARLILILGGLVPHGIFELSAFFVAGALGLRFGLEWIQSKSAGQRQGTIKNNFVRILYALPVIAILLFIAGLVEVFVSGRIVDNF